MGSFQEKANRRKHGVSFSEAVETFRFHRERGAFLLGRKIGYRTRADDPVYAPGTENQDNRVGGMAEIQEAG